MDAPFPARYKAFVVMSEPVNVRLDLRQDHFHTTHSEAPPTGRLALPCVRAASKQPMPPTSAASRSQTRSTGQSPLRRKAAPPSVAARHPLRNTGSQGVASTHTQSTHPQSV